MVIFEAGMTDAGTRWVSCRPARFRERKRDAFAPSSLGSRWPEERSESSTGRIGVVPG